MQSKVFLGRHTVYTNRRSNSNRRLMPAWFRLAWNQVRIQFRAFFILQAINKGTPLFQTPSLNVCDEEYPNIMQGLAVVCKKLGDHMQWLLHSSAGLWQLSYVHLFTITISSGISKNFCTNSFRNFPWNMVNGSAESEIGNSNSNSNSNNLK